MNDSLPPVGHAKELDAKLLDVLLEREDLNPRVGPAERLRVSHEIPDSRGQSEGTHSLIKLAESV